MALLSLGRGTIATAGQEANHLLALSSDKSASAALGESVLLAGIRGGLPTAGKTRHHSQLAGRTGEEIAGNSRRAV